MADTFAARSVYHAIVACDIRGVSVTSATDSARAGYHSCNSRVWSRHGQEYLLYFWFGCTAVLGAMQLVKLRS